MSGHCHVTPDGGATGIASGPAHSSATCIGNICTVAGSCTLTRPGAIPVQIKPGDPVCQGDIIETSAGGKVGIRFVDGTVFNLSDSGRMVMKEFTGDDASPAALFDISNGTFSFIAGEMAKAGRFDIDTPFANIRGRSRAGGIGMLSLASFFFAGMEEIQAHPTDALALDPGIIALKDLVNDYGAYELTLKTVPPQTIFQTNPEEMIIVRAQGGGLSVSRTALSFDQILNYANDAQRLYSMGGPAGTNNGGSGSALLLPPEFQPLEPFNGSNSPGGPLGSLGAGPTTAPIVLDAPPILPPPPPVPPTVTTDSSAVNVNRSHATITFTFSVAPTDFVLADTSATGGTLSDLVKVDDTHFTATFTATPGIQINNASVSVIDGSYLDVNGRVGLGASTIFTVDTLNPTVGVDIADGSLGGSDNSSQVTFTFSEQVSDATVAALASGSGITVTGGTLSNLTWNAAHTIATATFTAANDSSGTGSVTVTDGGFTDVVGNTGVGGSGSVAIDTQNPTLTVNIVDGSLSDGDNNSIVTFTFSEAPGASFTASDIQLSAGLTLNAGSLVMVDATHYQATVTAVDGFTGTGSVSVAAGSYTDAAGNLGGSGSDSVSIDTQNPTVEVNIVAASLNDTSNSSLVTFAFSEAPGASFTASDIQLSAGLTLNAGSLVMVDATHYQATVTAVDGFTGPSSVSVATGSYTDAAGNLGGSGSDSVIIDTQNPALTVNIVDPSLSDGDNSSLVTFAFSEAPGASFTESDIQVSAGLTLNASSLTMIDATHYQATVTASDNFTGTGSVSVATGSWTDAASNPGGAGSDTVTIDTQNPTLTVNIVDGSLDFSDNNSVVTFTFSEAPVGFSAGDIVATHGTITGLALDPVDPSGKTYTATFTADDSFTGIGSVSVAAGSFTDAASNPGGAGSDNVSIDTHPLADPNDFDDQATGTGLIGNTYRGSSGPDTIPAINQAQLIYGGAGNDTIDGGNSGTGETIYGGSGNDVINGNNGADTIFGGSGNDTIHGGEAKDTIIGGFGADTLWGDGGNDTFKYLSVIDSRGSQHDTIEDFDSANDQIDLTAIAGATSVQGLVGTANTVAAHSISWFEDSVHNETILYVNTTGTANHVDMEIHLTGTNIVNVSDILHA